MTRRTSLALVVLVAGCNAILGNDELSAASNAQSRRDGAAPDGGPETPPREAGVQPEGGSGGSDASVTPPTGGKNAGAGGDGGSSGAGRGGAGSGGAGSGGAGSGGAGSGGAGSGGVDTRPFCERSENDGKACDDGKHCTEGETCQSGTCTGGTPVTCDSPTHACEVNLCSEVTAGCATRPATDGAPCSGAGRVCENGACICPGGQAESHCADGADNDCDGLADCADTDCGDQQCSASATSRCCPSGCVDINKDPNNCGGCGIVCPKPPPYQGGEPTLEMCSYVQECDYRRFDVEVGTVCRLYSGASGCGGSAATVPECQAEAPLSDACGRAPIPPFWICNNTSTDCTLISAL